MRQFVVKLVMCSALGMALVVALQGPMAHAGTPQFNYGVAEIGGNGVYCDCSQPDTCDCLNIA
jgi:hypothetical protein